MRQTIAGETDQSGRVVHEVRLEGDDVEIVTRKLDTDGRFAVNVTPKHARELAAALLIVAQGEEILH